MSIKFTVLLYSKYSTSSSKIISIINQYQNIFIENFNIKLLCIDNENVRKRILESKKISITFVPSILVIYNDGGVEKYENNDAFNWVNEIIERVISLQQKQQESLYQKSSNENKSLGQEIDIEDNILDEEIEVQVPIKVKNQDSKPKKQQQSKATKQQSKSKPKKSYDNKTSIEDLEDLEDLEEMEDNDIDDNIFENDEPDIKQVESKNALSVKRNDLLSLASEMQKNRDTFVEKTDRPKLSLNR